MVPSFLKAFDGMGYNGLGHRNLVVIQLSGGNDGLNTIIPRGNDIYYRERPSIALKDNELIKLDKCFGFHPSLKPLEALLDKGELSIINNVGYPNPNRSHFRSLEIWHSASSSNDYLTTGWLGRYLDSNCQYPDQVLEVDDTLSLAVKGALNKGIAAKDAKTLYQTANDPYLKGLLAKETDEHLSEDNMGYLYKTMVETASSAEYIYEKSRLNSTSVDYPSSRLGRQLKTVGSFINSGLRTKVYYVSIGGFDTHASQKGSQARLLEQYAKSVEAFVKDLKQGGTFDDTLIMTFSEFGRRVKENASSGTDHGTANNMFLMGGKLKKTGFLNEAPDLSNLDKNGDLKFSVDFRQTYATVLDRWLEVDSKQILGASFTPLNFL